MKIISTKFKGLKLLNAPVFSDNRGHFREIFKNKLFSRKKFIFNCSSYSKKNVLRGLHLQTKFAQGKYISVLKGKIYDVALDLRKNSKTYGKYFSTYLSAKKGTSVYIPPGFAHGFLSMDKENIITYFCTEYRSKRHEIGILWNDKDLKINWPIKKPILSKKDKNNISLKKYLEKNG